MTTQQSLPLDAPLDARGVRTSCLLVTQWFPPEQAHTAERIVHSLQDAGLDVGVLTGVPHYPVGRPVAGYRAGRSVREVRNGIPVLRTPEYPNHSASVLRRMSNYLSWAVSSAVLGQRVLRDADVALVYSSPATAALPALIGRLLHGTPYVLLIQDLWPDSVFATGYGTPLIARAKSLLDLMCRTFYRHAAHICVISPGMVDVLVARGVPRDKLTLVYNWRVDRRDDVPPPSDARIGTVRLLYAGNHGPAQGLEHLVRAAAACPSIDLTLMGDGTEKPRLLELAQELGARNVHFHDRVDPSRFESLQREFDVQIASLGAHPLFAHTMPNKVQGILASGMPFLAIAEGDVAQAAERSGGGWTAHPGDVDSIRRALERVSATSRQELRRMGTRAREYYDAHMSRSRNVTLLRGVLLAAASSRAGARR